MTRHQLRLPVAFFLVLPLVSCGGDGGGADVVDPTASIPATVLVTPTLDTLTWINETVQLQGTALNSTGVQLGATISWSSSAPSVATVGSTGLVTAVSNGAATITARAGNASASATILIRQVASSFTKVSGDDQSGQAGELLGASLVARAIDLGGTPVPGAQLEWSVLSGEGSLESSDATTGNDGLASASWRLGYSVGDQSVESQVDGGATVVFSAVATLPEADRVEIAPGAVTLGIVGDTARFTAEAFAGGTPLVGAPITFVTDAPAVASVDSAGLVTALGEGTTSVTARSGSATASATVTVDFSAGPAPAIASVQPSVLVEGETATITGSGFGTSVEANEVLIDGAVATIVSASATALQITVPSFDCFPPREVTVTVRRDGQEVSEPASITPAQVLSPDVGDGWYASDDARCLHLDTGGVGREYVIGALSVSEAPSSLTPSSLLSRSATVLASDMRSAVAIEPSRAEAWVMPSPSLPLAGATRTEVDATTAPDQSDPWRGHWRAEAELREREEDMIRALEAAGAMESMTGGTEPQRTASGLQLAVPSVGDTLTMGVGGACVGRDTVRAVATYVGSGMIFLEDVANPGPAFLESELQSLDALYAEHIAPTVSDYFGDNQDVDGNGRIVVLMTKSVNEQQNVLGYVWSGDQISTTYCPGSNEAEIFYGVVPDPQGQVGHAWSKEDVLGFYPALITHEVTHVVQFSERIWGQAGAKARWELEGGATLAEQLVGNRILGHGSREDLGYSEWSAGGGWYYDWVADLARYFGYESSTARVPGAPEECTWIGTESEGNTGPCRGSRMVYGVPSTLMRYVLDHWGPGFPGGETAMMRRMTQSPSEGFATLEDATGQDIEGLLTSFASALMTDGRYFDSLLSWDIDDIFGRLPETAGLEPYLELGTEPTLDVSVRGGSTAFLHWTPAAGHGPTSIRLRTPSDGPLPGHMVLWIVRLR
jgi:hypothetical protein